jgi:hypothetical protein
MFDQGSFGNDRDSRPAGPGDDAPTAPDARGAARYNLLIRPAKLVGAEGEFVCVLRDVSNGGCKVRLFHPLPFGGPFELELATGERHPVEAVWERDGHAGLRFLAGVAVESLISEDGPFRRRPVRLRMALDARLVARGEVLPVVVRDLSQQGAQLEGTTRLAVDQQVRLEVPGLSPIVAKVRWRRASGADGVATGLVFEQTFRLDELAAIAVRLQAG